MSAATVAMCLVVGCSATDRAAPITTPLSGDALPTETIASERTFATLPSVDRFTYPAGSSDVVAQIAVRAPLGPDVPLLTVYGDRTVISATNDGWRIGQISDLGVQGLLDDAESVGLLDDALVLRGPETISDATPLGPDITIRFDINGRTLVHELDLSRIERPPDIRVFINNATVRNRFDLTEPFEPGAWIACAAQGCEVVESRRDAASRPVFPGEDPADLLAR